MKDALVRNVVKSFGSHSQETVTFSINYRGEPGDYFSEFQISCGTYVSASICGMGMTSKFLRNLADAMDQAEAELKMNEQK